jgi:hypothetical protein
MEDQMRPSFFAIPAAALILASNVGSHAATATHAVDVAGWRVYRNERYSLELRYPSDYAVVLPHNHLQPPPLFRVWFKPASLVNSPIADREPPQFAVDVYDKASQQPLGDTWLTGSGDEDVAYLDRPARHPPQGSDHEIADFDLTDREKEKDPLHGGCAR